LFAWDVSGVLVIEQGLMDVGTLLRRCRDYHRGLDADAAAMVADLLHRLYIAATACIGLAHMHACGVVHADLKTNNVVVACSRGTEASSRLRAAVGGASSLCARAGVGKFVAKVIDMSRAVAVPVAMPSTSSGGEEAITVASTSASGVGRGGPTLRVPVGAVALHHRATKYRELLAPELWAVETPYICTATDVHAMVRRVLEPLLEHPLSRGRTLLEAHRHLPACHALDSGFKRALAENPGDRPTAHELSHLLIDALAAVACCESAASPV
jgi:hypothetical protein